MIDPLVLVPRQEPPPSLDHSGGKYEDAVEAKPGKARRSEFGTSRREAAARSLCGQITKHSGSAQWACQALELRC